MAARPGSLGAVIRRDFRSLPMFSPGSVLVRYVTFEAGEVRISSVFRRNSGVLSSNQADSIDAGGVFRVYPRLGQHGRDNLAERGWNERY